MTRSVPVEMPALLIEQGDVARRPAAAAATEAGSVMSSRSAFDAGQVDQFGAAGGGVDLGGAALEELAAKWRPRPRLAPVTRATAPLICMSDYAKT